MKLSEANKIIMDATCGVMPNQFVKTPIRAKMYISVNIKVYDLVKQQVWQQVWDSLRGFAPMRIETKDIIERYNT